MNNVTTKTTSKFTIQQIDHDCSYDRCNLCIGTTFRSDWSGADFTYQPCDLFFPVHSGN